MRFYINFCFKNDFAVTSIEYALIASLIAIAVTSLGQTVSGLYNLVVAGLS